MIPTITRRFLETRNPLWLDWYERWQAREKLFYGNLESDKIKEYFLPRAANESNYSKDVGKTAYQERLEVSQLIPDSPRIVARVRDRVYSKNPTRQWPKQFQDAFERFEQDVDYEGTSMTSFMSRLGEASLISGNAFCLVDKFSDTAATLGEQMERRTDLPHLVMFKPYDIVNWALDRYGRIDWVVIKYMDTQISESGYTTQDVYLVYQSGGLVNEWRIDNGVAVPKNEEGVVVDPGVIPIVQMAHRKAKELVGTGLIESSFRADLQKMQRQSEQALMAHLHANAFLVIRAKAELKEIFKSSARAIRLDPDSDERFEYVAPPTDSHKMNQDIIDEMRMESERNTGVNPVGTTESVKEMSGISKAWSFKTSEENTLASHARLASDTETKIWQMVARWLKPTASQEELDEIQVTYDDKFDLTPLDDRITRFITLKSTGAPQSVLRAEMRAIGGEVLANAPNKVFDEFEKELGEMEFTSNDFLNGFEDTNDGQRTEQPEL